MKRDLSKEVLYDSVKTIFETDRPHILLPQHKLFTLFSIAFQYMLYRSTKDKGAYIIRLEDSKLADKLARKSKDPSTRKFIQSLALPRKLKYGGSCFYLDFFYFGSWNLTKDLPPDKVKGAIIVKDFNTKPMVELDEIEDDEEAKPDMALPKDYFLTSLTSVATQTITIALDGQFDDLHKVEFPFIKKDSTRTIDGVTVGSGLDWDSFDN